MSDAYGLGNDGTETSRQCKPHDSDDQMNEKDAEIGFFRVLRTCGQKLSLHPNRASGEGCGRLLWRIRIRDRLGTRAVQGAQDAVDVRLGDDGRAACCLNKNEIERTAV